MDLSIDHPSDSIYLAVYGTLKRGNHNYEVYLAPILPIFSEKLALPYQLFSNGRYPMLITSFDSPKEIFVEVYQLTKDQFNAINDLEEPFGYHWEIISIDKKNLDQVRIFVFDNPKPPKEFTEIEHGNFKAKIQW